MMYSGQAAINFLADEISKSNADEGASSHWRHFHSRFSFTGDGFDGLQGFGGSEKPHRGLRLGLNRVLQSKFRRMGSAFPQFRMIEDLATQITATQHRAYDLDVLRQTITLAFLKKQLPDRLLPNTTVFVIGDGFASMTALVLASRSAGRVILINLTKTLLVDLWYLKRYMGDTFEDSVDLVIDKNGLANALKRNVTAGYQIIALQANQHELLRHCSVDLAVNIASMQEMNPPVIAAYFDDLRYIASKRQLYFYCCNREEKSLPDNTVTRFSDYPWEADDGVLVDELCPWHQQY